MQPKSDVRGILTWLVACALAFELVVVPLAWLMDRIALGWRRGEARRRWAAGAGKAYVRVPALLSGLLLLVFLPLIFKLGISTYVTFDGSSQSGYLVRWLVATGVLFGCSGMLYAISLLRARRREAMALGSRPSEEGRVERPRPPRAR